MKSVLSLFLFSRSMTTVATEASSQSIIDLIVVGGGISGLVCADEARNNGLNVIVLEARDRVGGRLLSHQGIDLGGAWGFPPHERQNIKLAQRLHVPVLNQRIDGNSFVSQRGTMNNVGEMGGRLAPCGPEAVRFKGGYSELPIQLANTMSSIIQLSTHVTAVELEDHDQLLRVFTQDKTEFRAKRVVMAMPPAVMANTIIFTPALPAEQHRQMKNTATWCGDWCKVVAIFQTAFWRDVGASGVVQTEGEPISIWYEGGSGTDDELAAITGLGFGVNACGKVGQMLEGDNELLKKFVIKSLGPAFGGEKIIQEKLVAVNGKSWATDKLTYAPDASSRNYGHPLLRQKFGGIFFAGSETERMNGHVEGAIIAGQRAAKEVLESLL